MVIPDSRLELSQVSADTGPTKPEQFAADIAELAGRRISTLPPFEETIDYAGKISDDVAKYKRMDGFYVADDARPAFGERVDEMYFLPRRYWRLGREDSDPGEEITDSPVDMRSIRRELMGIPVNTLSARNAIYQRHEPRGVLHSFAECVPFGVS